MNPLSIGKSYCLRLPDGRVLGHVRIRRMEEPWAEGSFQPGTAFAPYRDLFEREARLRHDQVIPLWEDVADAIDALQIQVVEEGGQHPVQPRLRVYVEGDEAFLGIPA
ncbi:MAG TPA: hypothetical protein VJ739_12715 [Gemmataceae bacterium]|nr:hypothetical protein [Gemmataceae bacterium]